ncbi:MAG: phosphoribosylglycinamide formyltransferase [Christensenellaceae bacterium]|jgi:phosphoribosylglycinamide formyltransferase-1|nr:phosphoribosylglycinamide formyltransferase [Christensenellaceae bacterium]
MIKFAVFASGGGTDFQSIIDAKAAGIISHGQIAALISNKADAGVLERARKADISAFYVDHTISQENTDAEILKILKQTDAQFVFLAGYLKKISPAILDAVPVYNIHPAIDLKRFGGKGMYGLNVHTAVIAAGEKFTGATIHSVNEIYDDGKILMQTPKVPVLSTDTPETLQQRVLAEEHKLIPQFIDILTREMDQKQQPNNKNI